MINQRLCRLTILVLMCVFIIYPFSISHAKSLHDKYLVMIDPAHGGDNRGVKLSDIYYEKDIVLAMALAIQKELKSSEKINIKLTRTEDVDTPISQRIKSIESNQPDLFISLHVNAGFGKSSGGYEVYFPGFKSLAAVKDESTDILKDMAKNKYLNESVKLAQAIQKNLQDVFPRKGRGLREAPISILEGLNMPAVVIEIAFATNLEDRTKLSDAKIQQAIVCAISRSIKDYF